METIPTTPTTGDERLDSFIKFASRLRDNGVTTFELTLGDATLKVVQSPHPPSPEELKKLREQDYYSAG